MNQPTYDSRETGPRYHITTTVNGETIAWQHPLDDPFVSHTVHIVPRDLLRALLRGKPLVVRVQIGADRDLIDDVFNLDANYAQAIPE